MELHVAIPDSYRDIFLDVWQNMFVSFVYILVDELIGNSSVYRNS
jgi:hypothetical protein